jgi:hypothetical protein
MVEENNELLRKLCEEAMKEHNLGKLLEIVAEMEGVLDEEDPRFRRLRQAGVEPDSS